MGKKLKNNHKVLTQHMKQVHLLSWFEYVARVQQFEVSPLPTSVVFYCGLCNSRVQMKTQHLIKQHNMEEEVYDAMEAAGNMEDRVKGSSTCDVCGRVSLDLARHLRMSLKMTREDYYASEEDTLSILSCSPSEEDTSLGSIYSCSSSEEENLSVLSTTSNLEENLVENRILMSPSQQTSEEAGGNKCTNSEFCFKMRTTEARNKIRRERKKYLKTPLSLRYLVHSRNVMVWDQKKEEQSECLSYWMALRSRSAIQQFSNISPGAKKFFSMWNQWLYELGQDVCRLHLGKIVSRFVEEEGRRVMRRGLHRQFVLHLLNLEQVNLLGVVEVIRLTTSMQKMAEED